MLSVGLMAAAASRQAAFHIGLLLTAFAFGFGHGIDWDHIAALTDITGSQAEPRRSPRIDLVDPTNSGATDLAASRPAVV